MYTNQSIKNMPYHNEIILFSLEDIYYNRYFIQNKWLIGH